MAIGAGTSSTTSLLHLHLSGPEPTLGEEETLTKCLLNCGALSVWCHLCDEHWTRKVPVKSLTEYLFVGQQTEQMPLPRLVQPAGRCSLAVL